MSKKNLLCRHVLYSKLTGEYNTCKFGEDCRGAHSEENIVLYPGNKLFNELDKSTYDFKLLFGEIKKTIISDKYKIKLERHVNTIDNIDKLNNIELLQFWRELACYYRKISKTDKAIPQFDLKEYEDIAWAFERKTKLCKTFLEENNKENINKDKICCGSYNCKEGVHNQEHISVPDYVEHLTSSNVVHSINELICIDDFIGNKCDCLSKIDSQKRQIELLEEYNKKARELLQNSNYSIKTILKKELDIMNIEINNVRNRKEHFTEYGMIPIKVNPIEPIIEDKKPTVIKLKFPLGKK